MSFCVGDEKGSHSSFNHYVILNLWKDYMNFAEWGRISIITIFHFHLALKNQCTSKICILVWLICALFHLIIVVLRVTREVKKLGTYKSIFPSLKYADVQYLKQKCKLGNQTPENIILWPHLILSSLQYMCFCIIKMVPPPGLHKCSPVLYNKVDVQQTSTEIWRT